KDTLVKTAQGHVPDRAFEPQLPRVPFRFRTGKRSPPFRQAAVRATEVDRIARVAQDIADGGKKLGGTARLAAGGPQAAPSRRRAQFQCLSARGSGGPDGLLERGLRRSRMAEGEVAPSGQAVQLGVEEPIAASLGAVQDPLYLRESAGVLAEENQDLGEHGHE